MRISAGSACAGYGAIGGATSAVLSPWVLGQIDPTGAPLDPGQIAAVTVLATLAGGSMGGLAGQNAMAGATAAQNEALSTAAGHIKPSSSFDTNGGEPGLHVDAGKETLNILPPNAAEAAGPQPGAGLEAITAGNGPVVAGAAGGRMSLSDAQAYGRAAQLQSQLPLGSQGRVTMGVGVVLDPNGNQVVVVSTSEPNGYLRPGVSLNPGEVVIKGTGHAEADITSWAAQNGYTVQTVGAGRPICANCAGAISGANAVPATPLKVPK